MWEPTAEQLNGTDQVNSRLLRGWFEQRRGHSLFKDQDFEFFAGRHVFGKLRLGGAFADEPVGSVTARRLSIIGSLGAFREFFAAVLAYSRLQREPGESWADFLKRIVDWLMSEEGQEFIQMIIDLVFLFLGLA